MSARAYIRRYRPGAAKLDHRAGGRPACSSGWRQLFQAAPGSGGSADSNRVAQERRRLGEAPSAGPETDTALAPAATCARKRALVSLERRNNNNNNNIEPRCSCFAGSSSCFLRRQDSQAASESASVTANTRPRALCAAVSIHWAFIYLFPAARSPKPENCPPSRAASKPSEAQWQSGSQTQRP